MKSARSWALALLQRSERATLDRALLTGQGAGYAASRVSVVGLRALLRTAVHAAEIWVLARDFPFEFLAPLFALRALPSLVTGVHWGALETLRTRVRQEAHAHRGSLARVIIEAWLAMTSLVTVPLALALTVWVAQKPVEHGADSLVGSFVILSAWSLVSDLWTRTYHAGVFALGRVYRPRAALFLPDLLELSLLVATHQRLGPFALHLMVLFGTVLRAGITFVYSRRAYHSRAILPPRHFRLRGLGRLTLGDVWDSAKHAAATLPSQFDRLLLFALLDAPAPSPEVMPLAVPYYALRPIANYAQAWVRTFYADFVRLDMAAVSLLRLRFERLLSRAAMVTGALSALGVLLGSYALFGPPGLVPALWLAPLSLLRSRFALEQVRAFSYHDLPALMRTGAVLLAGLYLTTRVQLNDQQMLAAVLLVLGVVQVAFGRVQSRASERRMELRRRLPVSAWLAHLAQQQKPVRLAIAMVDARVARAGALLTVLSSALVEGRVARLGRAWVLWWEPLDGALPRAELASLLAGSVQKLELVSAASGRLALDEARASSALPHDLGKALALPRDPRAHEHLRERARALIPEVRTIERFKASASLREIAPRELTILRRVILAEANEQGIVPSYSPWQVAVYAPGGETELIFVWPAHTPHGGTLQRDVLGASWRDSLS